VPKAITEYLGHIRRRTFWVKLIVISIPCFIGLAVICWLQSVVLSFESSIIRHVLTEQERNTQVFLDAIEFQKGVTSNEGLLAVMEYRISRLDEEFSISSLLLNSNLEVISERKYTEPFCDPFTQPIDSPIMIEELRSGKEQGNFELHHPDIEGNATCIWYYQKFYIGNESYFILVGVQPTAILGAVDLGILTIPIFSLGLFFVALMWAFAYLVMQVFPRRSPEARTRRGDLMPHA